MASMKRQRRVDHVGGASVEAPKVEGATMSIPSKKHKTRAAAKVKEEAVIKAENVSIDAGYDQMVAAQVAVATVASVVEDESYSCSRGSVWLDEQMSWGSIWSPLWDVELMGEAHYGLFSEHGHGVWDDDIWGLRTTSKEISIPNR
ncbi:uncharacterized protein LOC126791995 [Argentina anserina]|uniref:uncharacterized protein LOC126791995 n=1 Tax=Argentina anserina TaxID=57926 RepID=UPI0021767D39|nr:uncharacterized protein LOC126791995 [Potentilla anserina]